MADFTFTAANVISSAGSQGGGTAGEALTAGLFLYADAADGGKLKKADNTSAAKAKVVGIALNDAAAGQPINYANNAEITVQGGVFASVGLGLVLSVAGKCSPEADAVVTDFMTFIGHTSAANKFKLDLNATGLQKT